MPRDFSRTRRVAEQIQRELAVLIRDEIQDPRLGMVSISGVEVSRDMGHAKVYISVLGEEDAAQASLEVLKRAAGFLRRELGRQMVIRSVPQCAYVTKTSACLSTIRCRDRARRRPADPGAAARASRRPRCPTMRAGPR